MHTITQLFAITNLIFRSLPKEEVTASFSILTFEDAKLPNDASEAVATIQIPLLALSDSSVQT